MSIANNRIKAATLDLGSSGAPVRVSDTILDNVAFNAVGTAPVAIDASRFIGGTANGSVAAPVTVSDSHMGGVAGMANVAVQRPLAAPQIGSMDVTPLDPQIGTNVVWSVDLPPSLAGVWIIGPTSRWPVLSLPQPLHLYFNTALFLSLTPVMRGQTQLPVLIPNDQSFVGGDLFVQLVVVPDPGFAAPSLSLPPGRRFIIR